MSRAPQLRLPDALTAAGDLPSPPGVVVEVLRLSRDDDAGIDEYARIVSGDPAIAAKLIKLSNSSVFGSRGEVKTLEQACVLLGLKTVQIMALGFSLTRGTGDPDDETAFPLKEYWARSLIAAVAGRAFSKRLERRLDDEAFLCGLLSQIGELAILDGMPDAYRAVLARSGGAWPTRGLEREVLGFDRSSVGGALLQSWGLPDSICLSIAHAERPEALATDGDAELSHLAELTAAAEQTADVLRSEEKATPLTALRRFGELNGLGEEELDALLSELSADIRETAELLDVDFEPGEAHVEILEEARQQVMRLSLGTAADLRQAERRANHLASENRELAEKASKDELTGIPNRAGFDDVLAAEIAGRESGSRNMLLGILMIDADHFKRVNDSHGHRAGDAVLARIGAILERVTRGSDVPARYGGEEFAVIAPQATPEGLRALAERLRQTVEAETIDHEGIELCITVSIGGVCLGRIGGGNAAARLVEAADQHLYEAKHDGRNRCSIALEALDLD